MDIFSPQSTYDLDVLKSNVLQESNVMKLLDIELNYDTNHKELEIFSDYDNDVTKSVFRDLDKTQTLLGSLTLKKHLLDYKYDKNKINKFKNMVSKIEDEKIDCSLTIINDNLPNIFWFYKEFDENLLAILNQLFFNFKIPLLNDFLNDNKFMLNVSTIYNIYLYPLTNLLGPIVSILIPYIMLRIYKFKIPLSTLFKLIKRSLTGFKTPKKMFSVLLYIVLFLYSTYKQFRNSYDLKQMVNMLFYKLKSFTLVLRRSCELLEHFGTYFEFPDVSYLVKTLSKLPNEVKMFMLPGNVLYLVRHLRQNKTMVKLLKILGEIDLVFALHSLTKSKKYSWVKFRSTSYPYLSVKALAHPLLVNPVVNSLVLKNTNIIITGPNAAGKSTFVKSIGVNVILAQTLGICCAKKMTLTPFAFLKTHLNTPDRLNRESLFEAEMYKCKDIISNVSKDCLSLVILDELFSSTNPYEGLAGSCAIIKKISEHKNSCTILTTHYDRLPHYGEKIGFKNFMFPVKKIKNSLHYTYKLKRGISKKYVALDILKLNGYDPDIIATAHDVLKSFKF